MKVSEVTRYWKTVVAVGGVVATFLQALIADPSVAQAVADDTITSDEWWRIIIAAATAVFVYAIPNHAPAQGVHRHDLSEQG